MADNVTKEDVVEFISNMTVLELSEFVKELEDKFGVSAAAGKNKLHILGLVVNKLGYIIKFN